MRKEGLFRYWPKATWRRYRELITYFGNIDDGWIAPEAAYAKMPWTQEIRADYLHWRRDIDEARIEAELTREGITCLTADNERYPALLKEIYDPPFVLFARGELPIRSPAIAVVGTRRPSEYGERATKEITSAIVAAGITVVSGLAYGIDSIAHRETIALSGKTVAVLGSGVDRATIFPSIHRPFADEIVKKGGAIITEYPPGFKPTAYSFPERNRVIAGMTLCTIVTEAPIKSGALITAACALDCNREVMAVPQPYYSITGAGANELIKQGAKMITCPEDIFAAIGLSKPIGLQKPMNNLAQNQLEKKLSLIESNIYALLNIEPTHIDELINKTELASHLVVGTLTLLEAKGVVKNLGSMMYVRA